MVSETGPSSVEPTNTVGPTGAPTNRPTPLTRRLWRRLRARLLALLVGSFRRLSAIVGWRVSQFLGRGLGQFYWTTARRDRQRILDHLTIAFPELSRKEQLTRGRACCRHLGCALAECLHLWGRPASEAQRYLTAEGFEIVEAARSSGRPVLFLTGHCGNWELLAPTLAGRGIALSAVVRSMDEKRLNDQLNRLREHFGTEILERGNRSAARQLLGVLRRGGSLTLLIDQDIKADGAWVPFFDRTAFTPTGAAQIAIRQKALVIPAFMRRLEDGTHLASFQTPLDLPNDLVEATALMTRTIEEQIRCAPEQWVWMHRRWRRRPVEE